MIEEKSIEQFATERVAQLVRDRWLLPLFDTLIYNENTFSRKAFKTIYQDAPAVSAPSKEWRAFLKATFKELQGLLATREKERNEKRRAVDQVQEQEKLKEQVGRKSWRVCGKDYNNALDLVVELMATRKLIKKPFGVLEFWQDDYTWLSFKDKEVNAALRLYEAGIKKI